MVKEITSASEIPNWNKVVLDFYATWCGPCKRIAPLYQEMSEKYPNVTFYKVNVDEAAELSENFSIESLPTFLIFQNGKIVKRIEGGNPNALLSAVDSLSEA